MSIGETISVIKLFGELIKLAFQTLSKKAPKGFLVNLIEVKSADIKGCFEGFVKEKRYYKLSIDPIPYETPTFYKNFEDTILTVKPSDDLKNIMEIDNNFIRIEPDRTHYIKLEREIELEFDRKARILNLNLQIPSQDSQIRSPEIELLVDPSSDPIINKKIKNICQSNLEPNAIYKIYVKNNMLIDIKRFPIEIPLNLPLDKICVSKINHCSPDLQITTKSKVSNLINLNEIMKIGLMGSRQDGSVQIYISEIKSNSECIIAVGIWYKES